MGDFVVSRLYSTYTTAVAELCESSAKTVGRYIQRHSQLKRAQSNFVLVTCIYLFVLHKTRRFWQTPSFSRQAIRTSWKCLEDSCLIDVQGGNCKCVLIDACVIGGKLLGFGHQNVTGPAPSWFGSDRTQDQDMHTEIRLELAGPEVHVPQRYARGTTLLIEYAHFNIVHTMLDMVYPVFLSMVQLGIHVGPQQPIRILHRLSHVRTSQTWFLYLLGDLGVNHMSSLEPICFEEMVVGGGDQGLFSWDSNYAIPGGQFGALKAFRDMIYFKAHINLSKDEKVRQTSVLLLDQRKRPVENITGVVEYIKQVLPNALVKNTVWESVVSSQIHNPSNWQEHQMDYMVQFADFQEKLNLLRTTDIMIAGIGSSHLFEFLLPDGSVSLNYGTCDNYEGIGTFFDDYLMPGIDWVRALYYVNKTDCNGPNILISQKATHCLLKLALKMKSNIAAPIDPLENCSPFGKAMFLMARRYPDSWFSLRQPLCKRPDIALTLLRGNMEQDCGISGIALKRLRADFIAAGTSYPCNIDA